MLLLYRAFGRYSWGVEINEIAILKFNISYIENVAIFMLSRTIDWELELW